MYIMIRLKVREVGRERVADWVSEAIYHKSGIDGCCIMVGGKVTGRGETESLFW